MLSLLCSALSPSALFEQKILIRKPIQNSFNKLLSNQPEVGFRKRIQFPVPVCVKVWLCYHSSALSSSALFRRKILIGNATPLHLELVNRSVFVVVRFSSLPSGIRKLSSALDESKAGKNYNLTCP